MLSIIAASVGAIGAGLMILGLVGRRVGDEPRCTKCGYDLRGADVQANCPECGAGPAQRRVGQRRRRPIVTSFGALLIITCGVAFLGLVRQWAAGFDYYTITPSWVLFRWVDVEEDHDLHAADVLAQRWIDGTLSDNDALRLFRVLIHPYKRTRPHNANTPQIPFFVGISSLSFGNLTLETPALDSVKRWVRRSAEEPEGRSSESRPGRRLSTGLGFSGGRGILVPNTEPSEPYTLVEVCEVNLWTPDESRHVSWTEEIHVVSDPAPDDIQWPGLELIDDEETEQRIVEAFLNAAPETQHGRSFDRITESDFLPSQSEETYLVPIIALQADVVILASMLVVQDDRIYPLKSIRSYNRPPSASPVRLNFLTSRESPLGLFGRGSESRRERRDSFGVDERSTQVRKRGIETWKDELLGEATLIVRPDLEDAWFSMRFGAVWGKELRFRLKVTEESVEIVERITDW